MRSRPGIGEHACGADRDRRAGLPLSGRRRSRGLLALVVDGHRRDPRGPGGALGRRALLRPGGRAPGAHEYPLGRLSRSGRPLRSGVLRDLDARGGLHGPAAAPDHGGRLGGARARRAGARARRAERDRRLYRRLQLRLRPARGARARVDRRLQRHRRRAQHHRQPGILFPRPARTQPRHRQRLLLVPGRGPRRLPQPARGRVRHGDRRRGQRHARARADDRLQPGADDGRRRPLQDLRRARRRLRARRGRGRRGPEAPGARPGRRRPGGRGDPRQRRQSGRLQQRPDRAQPEGAGGGHPGGLPRRRRRARRARLHRGPRHRHGARRSHRGQGPGQGLGRRPARGKHVRAGLGQDQHRASGIGGGHRRADQGGAFARAPPDPAEPALPQPQPPYPLRLAAARGAAGARALAEPRACAGRGQLLRLRRHQRPRGPRDRARRRRHRAPSKTTARAPVPRPHPLRQGRETACRPGRALRGGHGRTARACARRSLLQRERPAQPLPPPSRGHRRQPEGVARRPRGRPRGPASAEPAAERGAAAPAEGRLPVHRPGLPVPGHGPGAFRDRAGVQGDAGALRRAAAAAPRPAAAHRALQ